MSTAIESTRTNARPGNVPWRALLCGWLLLTLATLPAVMLTGTAPVTLSSLLRSLIFLVGIHTPWLLATPWLWRLCERWPVGLGRDVRSITRLVATGLVIIPLLSASGWLLGFFLSQPGFPPGLSPGWQRAVLATSLFALPTYFAVIGIGQTLAYIQRYRLRGERLAQAREEALRARLNHHFLFNALNAIGALGYRDPSRADAALSQLGDLLRIVLDSTPTIALREEVANAMTFVELQQLLLQRPLRLELQANAQAWDAQVPSLLLQPLIENAVRFSTADGAADEAITLDMSADRQRLTIIVGNACGDAGAGRGIGLDATRQRLQAMHGEHASISAGHDADSGRYNVRIQLPLPYLPEPA